MKKFFLIALLAVMTTNMNHLSARTIYGWCGSTMEVSDNASASVIRYVSEALDLICDIVEYGIPEEEDPDNPDEPVDPGELVEP